MLLRLSEHLCVYTKSIRKAMDVRGISSRENHAHPSFPPLKWALRGLKVVVAGSFAKAEYWGRVGVRPAECVWEEQPQTQGH